MDAKLRRELDAIARDDLSGAAGLASRCLQALSKWLDRGRKLDEHALLEVSKKLLKVQPSMAPILRIANEVAMASEGGLPAQSLARTLSGMQAQLRSGPRRVAEHLLRMLGRRKDWKVAIYSYSSTVVHALIRARHHLKWVECAEGRPGFEGRRMAVELARAGICVSLTTDAAMLEQAWFNDLFVIGADAILADGIVNKVGTECILRTRRGPVIVLTETLKFWPETALAGAKFWMWTYGHPWAVWKEAPSNVRVDCPLFSLAPFRKHVSILTERGLFTSAEVRQALRKIRISPRLKTLLD